MQINISGIDLAKIALESMMEQDKVDLKRDPVCEALIKPENAVKITFNGEIFYFCSEACKTLFEDYSESYLETPKEESSHIEIIE